MKALIQRLELHPSYSKVSEWLRLITITGSAQVVMQIAGFLTGVAIIQLLSTEEYAWYTIANTMLGTMIMLADSGISNGVMAEGGRVWQDKKKLGIVLKSGLFLRRKFGLISLVVTTPVLVYLLNDHHAGWITILLITVSVIPAFYAALSDSLLEIVPRLHQAIVPLQTNGIQVSIGRMFLISSLVFIFPFAFLALIANSIPRIYANFKLAKIAAEYASQNESKDPVVIKSINRSVNRTLPNVIYYCLSGQISLWLITLFGSTNSIAEIGALGRVSVVFNLVTAMFSALVIPRFSRMNTSKKSLTTSFLLIQCAIVFINTILLAILWLCSKQFLWVLGKNYSNLGYELLLMAISSAVGLLSGVCSQLNISRGWYLNPYLLIVISFTFTVLGFTILRPSSLVEVLYFNIAALVIHYIVVFFYGFFKTTQYQASSLSQTDTSILK